MACRASILGPHACTAAVRSPELAARAVNRRYISASEAPRVHAIGTGHGMASVRAVSALHVSLYTVDRIRAQHNFRHGMQ